jgi:predicted transcriptional regulator
MSKHSPGPWEYRHFAACSTGNHVESASDMVKIGSKMVHIYNKHDAILISEAPNMLGMLELALKYLEHPDVQAIPFAAPAECVAVRMRALIEKAKGEKS